MEKELNQEITVVDSDKEAEERERHDHDLNASLHPLKPGPHDNFEQCFIERDKATAIYRLYHGLTPALSGDNRKLVLAAQKVWKVTGTEFVISLLEDEFSQVSDTLIGKLRSNFLGTKFTIYDSQAPYDFAGQSTSRSNRKIHSKQASTRVPVGNYGIGSISYQFSVFQQRGPRRMECVMHSIPISAIQEGGTVPSPTMIPQSLEEQDPLLPVSKSKENLGDFSSTCLFEPLLPVQGAREPFVLKSKAPTWNEKLKIWWLNFNGRVTIKSVKNFQLVASTEHSHKISQAEQEKIILQFGKIGEDRFTMDYQYPLSAFQAFAICLSSFDTKLLCE